MLRVRTGCLTHRRFKQCMRAREEALVGRPATGVIISAVRFVWCGHGGDRSSFTKKIGVGPILVILFWLLENVVKFGY